MLIYWQEPGKISESSVVFIYSQQLPILFILHMNLKQIYLAWQLR
ncbi:MAG: hypothetical protein ACR2LR_13680 [Hassallia sp.]